MGSCVSHHGDSTSAVKLRLSPLQSKNQKLNIPSPVKHNTVAVNCQDHSVTGFAVKSQRSLPRFRDDGSNDEAFFDSQPWLESDCEDDFLSVNGDFTPSRGSTPVHHKFSSVNPTVDKLPVVGGTNGSVPEPSPKKRLSELFEESLRQGQDGDEEGEASDESVVMENGASNERSSNGVVRKEKSVQCCLPGLRSSGSFGERKKKTSLPSGT